MKTKLSLAILAALALQTPAHAVDLLQIYRDALTQDPVHASARAAYEANKEALPQSRASVLPSIGLSTSTSRSRNYTSGFEPGIGTSRGYSLSLSQPLFNMQSWIAVDQAGLQVKQAEAVLADASQNLILRTAQAYFDVLLAHDNVATSGAQKTAIAQQLAQAKRNFEVGTATITDTYEAQAKYDLASATEIADLNDLEIKKQALQQLIGKPAGTLNLLRENPVLPLPEPADMEKWVASAHEANPTIAQSQLAEAISKLEIERSKAGHLPTLDLSSSYGNSRSPFFSDEHTSSRSGSIGLTLTIPLYKGGATESRIRQTLASREKAQQDLENAKRTVAQTVRQSYIGVTNGVAQVKAREAGLVSSKSAFEATQLGRDVGVRTNVDVLNAQQQVFQTQRELQQNRYNTIMAQLKLKAAAGRLKEDDLVEINQLLVK